MRKVRESLKIKFVKFVSKIRLQYTAPKTYQLLRTSSWWMNSPINLQSDKKNSQQFDNIKTSRYWPAFGHNMAAWKYGSNAVPFWWFIPKIYYMRCIELFNPTASLKNSVFCRHFWMFTRRLESSFKILAVHQGRIWVSC